MINQPHIAAITTVLHALEPILRAREGDTAHQLAYGLVVLEDAAVALRLATLTQVSVERLVDLVKASASATP